MKLNIEGKRALVSGGTHGIGKAIAIELAKEGCDVAVFSRTQARVEEAKDFLSQYDVDNICLTADVLDDASFLK
jgi:3-oxoacyl-[acyl-carrier protein] reductase